MGNIGRVTKQVVFSSFVVVLLVTFAMAAGPPKGVPGSPFKAVSIPPDKKGEALLPLAPKLEVVSLIVQPTQPYHGDSVTVNFTVRNVGTAPAKNIPWGIIECNGSQKLASGEEAELGPGSTFSKSATWKAVVGARVLRGGIGPLSQIERGTVNPVISVALDVPRRSFTALAGAPATNSAKPAGKPVAVKVADRGPGPANARIDPKDLKINVAKVVGNKQGDGTWNKPGGDTGNKQGGDTGHKTLADELKTPQSQMTQDLKNEHKVKKKPLFIGENPIKGAKYGDTFRGEQINAQHGEQDPLNYRGDGKGNASMTEAEFLADPAYSTYKMISGRNSYDGNSYYRETTGKVVSVFTFDDKKNLRITQQWTGTTWGIRKYKIPNPNADDAGGGIVVTPAITVDQTFKDGMKTGGKAGGPDDGRNPDSETGPVMSLDSATSIMMGRTHGQEEKLVEGGGTVSMDEVLKINEVVNPTNAQ